MEFISKSVQETIEFASEFATSLKGGEVITLSGDLGAGKTVFSKGIAKGLGITQTVTSPTFTIMCQYLDGRLKLYHFDMYRVTSWEDLYSTGYFEYLEAGGVVAVEWSENIEFALPENTITIKIEPISEDERNITVIGGERF